MQKEKKLLKFIKYSPIIITVSISFLVNMLIYFQNDINFKKNIQEYQNNYIQNQKELIKIQVEKAYKDVLIDKEEASIDLKNSLKLRVNEAYAMIENIYNTYKNEGDEKVLEIIKSAIRNIRFNENRGYFYLHSMSGINILHPTKPSLENTNILNMKDKKGVYIIQDMIKNLKMNDEYFTSFFWYKPNDLKNEYEKFTYHKLFKPLNLIIGTGEYKVDFINKIKEHILMDHIGKVSYGKNGYLFVIDYDGNYLSHVKKEYIGMNRISLTDKNGFEITKEIIKTAKKGSGFVRYIGTIMPETGKAALKTTYVMGLQDWKWAIATGFYDKELQQNLAIKKKEIEKINRGYLNSILMISALLSMVFILSSMYVSKRLERYFKEYNNKIDEEINNNREKDYLLYQQTKMASMGEMIANIAHQWKQPLNLISTVASGIKFEKEFGIKNEKNEDEGLDTILNSTTYLSQTIDDFKNFFKPDKIKMEVRLQNTYKKILKLISSRFQNDGIEMVAHIDDIHISTYENILIQAVINIMNNAFDVLEERNIKRKLVFFDAKLVNEYPEKNGQMVNFPLLDNGGYVKIVIKDNAGGIPTDIIDRIFEAYFTTKGQTSGTGIGLYMTHEIIKNNMKGIIEVKNVDYVYENEQYRGAEFTIYLSVKEN